MPEKLTEDDLKAVFTNPYYAIDISPSLFGEHEHMVTKEEWVQANTKIIREHGIEEWLFTMLDSLETGGVRKE